MGRSYRVRFVVRVRPIRGSQTDAAWRTRYSGRATDANLAKWVALYHESLKPGGVNAHLNEYGGAHLLYAEIYDHDTDRVLARWNH